MSAIGNQRSRVARQADHRSAGFTLIEVLVVLAILALIGGLIFPRIDRMLDGARFAAAQSMVAAAAQGARAQALRTNAPVVLQASGDGRALLVDGRVVAELAAPAQVANSGAQARFFGDGSATPATFAITAGSRHAELRILSPGGVARWH